MLVTFSSSGALGGWSSLGDPQVQQRSLIKAKQILSSLPKDWRLIPGHRYDDFKGEVPDWISLEDAEA